MARTARLGRSGSKSGPGHNVPNFGSKVAPDLPPHSSGRAGLRIRRLLSDVLEDGEGLVQFALGLGDGRIQVALALAVLGEGLLALWSELHVRSEFGRSVATTTAIRSAFTTTTTHRGP